MDTMPILLLMILDNTSSNSLLSCLLVLSRVFLQVLINPPPPSLCIILMLFKQEMSYFSVFYTKACCNSMQFHDSIKCHCFQTLRNYRTLLVQLPTCEIFSNLISDFTMKKPSSKGIEILGDIFTYKTAVTISRPNSKCIGVVFRILQACLFLYIILEVFIRNKKYQKVSQLTSQSKVTVHGLTSCLPTSEYEYDGPVRYLS